MYLFDWVGFQIPSNYSRLVVFETLVAKEYIHSWTGMGFYVAKYTVAKYIISYLLLIVEPMPRAVRGPPEKYPLRSSRARLAPHAR